MLIAAALERGGLRAVKSRFMRGSVAWLALLLPWLAGLAVLALRARVTQYGWTPDRLAAGAIAAILCGHGLVYAVAVLLRGPWMQRIRQANVLMAVVAILAAAAWLNPVFGPHDIAARSLENRLAVAPDMVSDRDLTILAEEYGRAGQAALQRIEAGASEGLKARIAAARAGNRPDTSLTPQALRAKLPCAQPGAELPQGALEGLVGDRLRALDRACARTTPAGAPGCVAVVGDLLPDHPGAEAMAFYMVSTDRMAVMPLAIPGAELRLEPTGSTWPSDPAGIDAVLAGRASLGPAPITALTLGDLVILAIP